MQQWRDAKARHPDALIFFRVGDFYEMFHEDAEQGARLLGLTLTSRNNGGAANVPLAGVPVRARDEYLERLVRLGQRVAVCDQVEDAAEAKGLVRREVVETITPGAVLSDALLSERRNNFLVALTRAHESASGADTGGDMAAYALAAADISTGELLAMILDADTLEAQLARLEPAELLIPQSYRRFTPRGAEAASITQRPDWLFDAGVAGEELCHRFHVQTLDGFGFQSGEGPLVGAVGALVAYLAEVQPAAAQALRPPRLERPGRTMALDEMTRRNLELVEPLRLETAAGPGARKGTLLEIIDESLTAMGARRLRQWLLAPLTAEGDIWRRQEAVAQLLEDAPCRRRLRTELKEIPDLERLTAKVGAARILPRELRSLCGSLARLPVIRELLVDGRGAAGGVADADEGVGIGSPSDVTEPTRGSHECAGTDSGERALTDPDAARVQVAADGVAAMGSGAGGHPGGEQADAAPQGASEGHGVAGLNPTRVDAVPSLNRLDRPALLLVELAGGLDVLDDVHTLLDRALTADPPALLSDGGVIREGYDTELDALRATRDGARDFIASLQARERERTGIASLKVGFNKVFGYYLEVTRPNLDRVPADYERKQTLANAERFVTAELKEWEARALGAEERILEHEAALFAGVRRCVAAHVARLQDSAERLAVLDVLGALAHVAERRGYVRPEVHTGYRLEIRAGRHPVVETMMAREEFIPNDVVLDEDARIMVLTGPNMAGKSTVLRQVGLIQLLAQTGAFVPADRALLPVCDRIFTRVGASDNLVRGQSTFMVEMNETAAILHGASRRSLVLLDEIGRGTATYDGVSIAWAVTEHLHDHTGAKTIFATHYHELTRLADLLPALINANVAVREAGEQIVFLRRLEPGGADRSYGIQVGRLAGLPGPVVERAREILHELESMHARTAEGTSMTTAAGDGEGSAEPPADQLSLFHTAEPPLLRRLQRLEIETMTPLEALNTLAELRAEARGRGGGH